MRKVLFPHRHFDGRRLHSSRRPEPVEIDDKQVLPASAKVLEEPKKKKKVTKDA